METNTLIALVSLAMNAAQLFVALGYWRFNRRK